MKQIFLSVCIAILTVIALSSCSSTSNRTITVNGLSFEMIYVQGGTFTMGCTYEQENDCSDDEKNTHQVTLDNFYIGKYEVTQELWQAVMGTSIEQQRDKANTDYSYFLSLYGQGREYPMYYVSWYEAITFIGRLNKITGEKFRLPTEAEWEYAARGGKKSNNYKYSGSNYIDDVAWYNSNSGNETYEVGLKEANELGIYDMSGNVYEWCNDWYSSYSMGSENNPRGALSGSLRVCRGGSRYGDAIFCHVANRNARRPSYRTDGLGFRLVLLP